MPTHDGIGPKGQADLRGVMGRAAVMVRVGHRVAGTAVTVPVAVQAATVPAVRLVVRPAVAAQEVRGAVMVRAGHLVAGTAATVPVAVPAVTAQVVPAAVPA